jgi:hypothetical protein
VTKGLRPRRAPVSARAATSAARRAALLSVALALACAAFGPPAAAVLGGCGGGGAAAATGPDARARQAAARADARPAPLRVPLVALVPEGAVTIVAARPDALLRVPSLASLVAAVAPDDRLSAFAERTGVDLRRLEEAVVADFGAEGTLWLARGPFDAPLAVAEAGERLATVESRSDAPLVRRAGFFGNERVEVVALAPDALAVARGAGAVGPLGAMLACLRRRECRPALAPDSPRTLLRAHGAAPLVVYAPRGVDLPEGLLSQALFAGTLAAAVAVHGGTADPVRSAAVRVDLIGRFPATIADNLRSLLGAVGASELGGAFGLEAVAERARIDVADGRVTVDFEVEAARFRVGLRALAGAELTELLAGASSI